jgi:DUF1680 family protein
LINTAKYSSLEGTRALGESQCGTDLNCCVANGPRGLMLLPSVAVMTGAHGPVVNLYVNLYESGRYSAAGCDIEIKTAYPFEPAVDIAVASKQTGARTLSLRIPAWSEQTTLTLNGKPIAVRPGTYATVERSWKPGDRLRLQLDLRGRILRSGQFSAVARGPLVLARDLRLGQNIHEPVRLQLPLKAVPPPAGIAAAFATADGVHLCDYASAGNTWDADSRYRVWLPES